MKCTMILTGIVLVWESSNNKGENMKNVNKFTRAGHGKYIVCPECMHTDMVYHFAWSGLSCSYCEKIINKYDWLIRDKKTMERI